MAEEKVQQSLTGGMSTYHPLAVVASRIGLPQSEVKQMADAGIIPFVKGKGGRRYFNTCEVLATVNKIANAQQEKQAKEYIHTKESKTC